MTEPVEESRQLFACLTSENNFTDYQKMLHMPTGTTNNPNDPGNNLYSIFFDTFRKSTFYYKTDVIVEKNTQDKTSNYSISGAPFHGLSYTYMTQVLPSIKAAEGYKVKWIDNPMINQFLNIEMKMDDGRFQAFDNTMLHTLALCMTEKIPSIKQDLGNNSKLQTWSDILPSAKLEYVLPFFFSQNYSRFFPLYFCGGKNTIVFSLRYQLSIASLIRVMKEDTGAIVPMTNQNVIINNNINVLDAPIFHSVYTYQMPLELENSRCEDSKRDIITVDNVYVLDSSKSFNLGEEINIKLGILPYPVHTIYWMVENQNPVSYGGNFTTDAIDASKGESPIKSVSLTHKSGLNMFTDLEFSNSHMATHFRDVPHAGGFGAWSMGAIAADINPKPGINLSESLFTVKLKSQEEANPLYPFKENECKDAFKVKLRLVYTRIGKFTKIVSSDENRNFEQASFLFYNAEGKLI